MKYEGIVAAFTIFPGMSGLWKMIVGDNSYQFTFGSESMTVLLNGKPCQPSELAVLATNQDIIQGQLHVEWEYIEHDYIGNKNVKFTVLPNVRSTS